MRSHSAWPRLVPFVPLIAGSSAEGLYPKWVQGGIPFGSFPKRGDLRHSLASFLVRKGTDVKTVQKMLRHSDVSTALGIYAHSMSEDRLAAQDEMLAAMMTPSNAVN
ncbi:MAG: tyrosine-type recombinase/integrase [Acidobacteriia bacterium]|nr:tyrosine-type recombinase/integrase [Terriglobia bacterium]